MTYQSFTSMARRRGLPRPAALVLSMVLALSMASGQVNAQAALALPSLGDTERDELSPMLERKLGEHIMHEFRRDRDYLDDAPLLEYLNAFGSSLLAAYPDARGEANYEFFFFAVRDPMLNAFALPGGFIAVHSALILAAQNESELASVMAHEIGHVSQRHIARMLGKQKNDAFIPLAAFALAILAARSSPDAAAAMMIGGQGLALQRQLAFSRDAEREADRVGLQILRDANVDTSGMIAFFGRMQSATRSYGDNVPAFLRSHPLTTERIADIQARTQEATFRQRVESVDFQLIRARTRILQDESAQGMREATQVFESQIAQKSVAQVTAGKYGLAVLALRQERFADALGLLQEARRASQDLPLTRKEVLPAGQLFASLSIEIRSAAKDAQRALKEAAAAREQYPLSRGIVYQYVDALIATKKEAEAVQFLRDQSQLYRQEPQIQELLAKVYALQNKQALQHLALAESYALRGRLQSALEQLSIGRKAQDASFYELAVIDARERELTLKWREETKEKGRF